MSGSARPVATLQEFWAIPEAARFHELIGGEIFEKALPSGEHGAAQAGVVAAIHGPFHRRPGGGGPGGWWILTEVEVLFETNEIARPDVVAWRRETCPERPGGIPIRKRPDWICEVVSPGRPTDDTIRKLRLYHRVGIPHYWLLDTRDATLTVLRWSDAGYVTLLRAEQGETIRAEPFESIEVSVGRLFGDDPPDAL